MKKNDLHFSGALYAFSKIRKVIFWVILAFSFVPVLSQVPGSFNYQAVVRDAAGHIVSNQAVGFRFRILAGGATGEVVYEETFSVTTTAAGLINVAVGEGTPVTGSFEDIDWSTGGYFLEVAADVSGGTDYQVLGGGPLKSVPYALYAENVKNRDDADADPQNEIQDLQMEGDTLMITGREDATKIDLSVYRDNPGWEVVGADTLTFPGSVVLGTDEANGGKLVVRGDDVNSDKPLFEVKRKDGQTVFAVYNEGVRVYVGTGDDSKGPARSGFAIGGFDFGKGEAPEYLRVTSDSVRIYLQTADQKGPQRGGFAIGGFDFGKGTGYEFMHVSPDSVRINIGDPGGKGLRGGFAIGGFDFGKGVTRDYFKINDDINVDVVNPSQPRILWYPQKEAFLTGRVLVESSDSVGTNSFASGYESKAVGDYSQALGYRAHAGGGVATAIGRKARADGDLSYAFGDSTLALAAGSYAIGTAAKAVGLKSFALGSSGEYPPTHEKIEAPVAVGDYSYALGMGSQANGIGSFALGLQAVANGKYAFSLGFGTQANGDRSMAIGEGAVTQGWFGLAVGEGAQSLGEGAVAIGQSSKAVGDHSYCFANDGVTNGYFSAAIGANLTTNSPAEVIVGSYNDPSPFPKSSTWKDNDPVFVVGNGRFIFPSTTVKHNALVVLKSGRVGVGISQPQAHLEVEAPPVGSGMEQVLRLSVADAQDSYFDISNITQDDGVFAPMIRGMNGSSAIKPALYFIGQTTGAMDVDADGPPLVVFDARRTDGAVQNRPLFQWSTYNNARMVMLANGYLGLGTNRPDKLLTVNGDARITGDLYYGADTDKYVKPDFVFEKDYDRDYTIAEVEHFIRRNKHLPWMTPSAAEQEGVNLTRMSFEMLESVENMQLQIISLHNKLAAEQQKSKDREAVLTRLLREQQRQIELLTEKVEALEKRR